MAIERHLLLSDRQRFTTRNADLPRHQIQTGNGLGHGMLNLQSCVHLHKEEFAASIEQEFHCARANVADRLRRTHSRFTHRAAQLRGQPRCRRLFDNFLVAALDRAITLIEV